MLTSCEGKTISAPQKSITEPRLSTIYHSNIRNPIQDYPKTQHRKQEPYSENHPRTHTWELEVASVSMPKTYRKNASRRTERKKLFTEKTNWRLERKPRLSATEQSSDKRVAEVRALETACREEPRTCQGLQSPGRHSAAEGWTDRWEARIREPRVGPRDYLR